MSLEDAFWEAFKEIAATHSVPVSDLVTAISQDRSTGNLSSAVRLFILNYYRGQVEAAAASAGD